MDDLIKIGHKHDQVHNSITLHKLSESDSKLYTNFEFCEGKNHTHLKTYWSTKPSNLCWKKIKEKVYMFLEHGASSVQVDILTPNYLKIVWNMMELY